MNIAPCHYAIIFALGVESGPTEDLLAGAIRIRGSGFHLLEGGISGRRVVILRSGAGQSQAAKAAELLIETHRPKTVISAGFAGGLTPSIKRGSILLANCVQDSSGRQIILDKSSAPSNDLNQEQLVQFPAIENPSDYSQIKWPNFHIGKLLTLDRIIREPSEKQSLNEKHQALAVDMETYAIAEVCLRHKTPLSSIRVINDASDELLPPDVERLLHQKTEAARLGAAFAAILRRPTSIKDLWALKEKSITDSMELAKFIEKMISII